MNSDPKVTNACNRATMLKPLVAALAIAVTMSALTGCNSGSSSSATADNQEALMYQSGLSLYESKSYSEAAAKFAAELQAYPTGALADDATFYLAKSQYWLGDYATAITGFDSVSANFPDSNVLEASYYWKGKAQQNNNEFAAARLTYQFILDEFTASRFSNAYVGDAHYGIAKTYYDAGDFITAANEFSAAATAITSLTTADSKLDNVLYYEAKSYHQALNFTMADAAYDSLITTFDGTTPEKTSSLVGNAKVQKGVILVDQQDFAGAKTYFTNLMADTTFASSTDGDLGQYTFAGVYYDEAKVELAAAVPDPNIYQPLLAQARTEFGKVISDYPLSSWADNAQYQIGQTYYDDADYVNATTAFTTVVTDYPDSSSADSAQYYLGRTLQQQASDAKKVADDAAALANTVPDYTGVNGFLALNASARDALQLAITNYPLSSVADNAQYQIGKTYYDEGDYANAITAFTVVITDYSTSSSADSAQYYLGRTLQKQAALAKAAADAAAVNAATTPDYSGPTGYTALIAEARTALQLAITNYPLSSVADNAQYQIGKTYYDEADYATARTELGKVISNYATSSYADNAQYYIGRSFHKDTLSPTYAADARAAYQLVLTNYPAGNKVDSAQYYLARTYHDEGDCVNEEAEMLIFLNTYPNSIYVSTAQKHYDDLNGGILAIHTCI